MKKRYLILSLLTATLLTGCGESGYEYEPATMTTETSDQPGTVYVASDDNAVPESANSSAAGTSTGGDYSRTTISSEFSDYNYSFAANGETNKTKQDMLNYYESLQGVVKENGGYIENVYNSYDAYVIEPDDTYISETEIQYTAKGCLNFSIEIPNDKITVITDNLENFCRENNFKVTDFDQKITNYEGYEIVDNYDQNTNSGKVITQKELDRKLNYATLSVRIDYRTRRSGFERFALGAKKNWDNFVESIDEVVMAFLAIAVGFIVLFVEAIIFYKIWKRMVYKHSKKRPQYYPAKHIVIDNDPEAATAETDSAEKTE